MGEVSFTKDKEKKRAQEAALKWEYLETESIVKAVRTARDMGWKEKKVQVRFIKTDDITTYYVEPFEKNCGCRGILKYEDYFI